MFKNYLLINGVLGAILMIIITMIIQSTPGEVEEIVLVSTETIASSSPDVSPIPTETFTPKIQSKGEFKLIHAKSLFNKNREVPPTETPKIVQTATPTPKEFDCDKTNITLSGIVRIENQSPYCFLQHPKDTNNEIAIYYMKQTIGDYTISEIKDESIMITAEDGSICELDLFNFEQQVKKTKSKRKELDKRRPRREFPKRRTPTPIPPHHRPSR